MSNPRVNRHVVSRMEQRFPYTRGEEKEKAETSGGLRGKRMEERWMKSTDGWFRNNVAMDVCTSVGGSSAKQTGLTALIAVIPNTYVVSPVCRARLSLLQPSRRGVREPSPHLSARRRSYPPVRRRSDRVSVFVRVDCHNSGGHQTKHSNDRDHREGGGGGRVSTPRVISTSDDITLPTGALSKCIRPLLCRANNRNERRGGVIRMRPPRRCFALIRFFVSISKNYISSVLPFKSIFCEWMIVLWKSKVNIL